MTRDLKHYPVLLAQALAKPVLLFYALPWLMCLLVLGTVAQRYLGLYASEKLFFSSFILWVGTVPMPGAYTVLALIVLSLLAKLALKSPLEKQQAGIIITHVSVLILLAGGLLTALYREEGYMVLAAGEASSQVSDYHQRELTVLKNSSAIITVPYSQLQAGGTIASPALPFSLHVRRTCYPCAPKPREQAIPSLRGVAKKIDIASVPFSKEDEENRPGLVLDVEGTDSAQDGTYVAFELLAQQPVITKGKDSYTILMRPVQRTFPFSVRLIRFDKSDYPGTDMARSYRSDVRVTDGAVEWNAAIEMNQPLRYRGYTFYQSSFLENGDKQASVLAVVKNAGQWFPYLAIATLCAGLLLHIAITLAHRRDA